MGAAAAATLTDEYDPAGRRTATVDAEGHRTEYRHDAAGRLIETIREVASTTLEYDRAGRKTNEIDAQGRRTECAYDTLGRLLKVSSGAA